MNRTPGISGKTPLAGPAMKAAVLFAAGIIASGCWTVNPLVPGMLLCIGIVAFIVVIRRERIGNTIAVIVLFCSGMFAGGVQQIIIKPADIPLNLVNQQVHVEGIVVGSPAIISGNTTFAIRCRNIYSESSIHPVNGILPCTMFNKMLPLAEGSHVLVSGKIRKSLLPIEQKRNLRFRNPAVSAAFRLTGGDNSPYPGIIEENASFFTNIRNYLSGLIDRYPFGGHSDLLRAMTIGDRSGVSRSVRQDFNRAGIAHILAVSGLHVGILVITLAFFLRLFPLPRKARFFITIGCLIVYAGICGFRPPVTRTVIMISMVMAGILFERPKNIENTLFVACLAILVFDPQALYGPSFQLSFAAVWAITTFYHPVIERIRGCFSPHGWLNKGLLFVLSIVVVSTLAFIATAPVTAYHFGSLPLLSIPVNIFAVPIAWMLVVLGALFFPLGALGAVAEPLAVLISEIIGFLLEILSGLAGFTARLPYAVIDTTGLSAFVGAWCAVWLYLLSRSQGRTGFKKALVFIPLIIVLVFTWSPLVPFGTKSGTSGKIVFFDVGQGDSALIEYNNCRFLVDTGVEYAAKTVVVPSLKNSGIRSLDGIFLSHMDADHTGGLDYILENIRVDRIYCRHSVMDSLQSLYGDRITGIVAGDSIAFHEGGIAVLSPFLDNTVFQRTGISGENNNSLLLRFNICGSRALFTGDIEDNLQKLLTVWDGALKSAVLKVPHHGSRDFQDEFLRKVDPVLSVISCGLNNQYGHPALSTVAKLTQQGSTVLRTDSYNTIVLQFPEFEVFSD